MKICMPCMIEMSCLMYAHLLALENQRESKTSTDRYLRRKLTYLAQLRSKKRNFLSMQCFTLQSYRLVAQNLANRALYNVVAFTSLSLFVILCHLIAFLLSLNQHLLGVVSLTPSIPFIYLHF